MRNNEINTSTVLLEGLLYLYPSIVLSDKKLRIMKIERILALTLHLICQIFSFRRISKTVLIMINVVSLHLILQGLDH